MSRKTVLGMLMTAFVILEVALLASCAKVSGKEKPSGPRVCVMALFDLSASTKGQAIRGRYLDEYGAVLKDCQGGEALVADAITDNPLAEGSFPIDQVLPSYDPLKVNEMDFQGALKRSRQGVEDEAHEFVLKGTPTQHTDILNALLLAEKIFNGDRFGKAPNKVLILFSDMRQDSADYNFDRLNLTPSLTQKILAQLKSKGQLPNLAGVKVWVAGAGVSEGTPLPANKILAIQHFWLAYFKACGADLTSERYAPALINFALAPA